MRDVARVYEIDRRDEVIRILEKERPQLRKVNWVTLVHGELRLIRLGIAEIRIDGCIENNAVLQDDLGLSAGSSFEVTRAEVRVRRIDIDETALVLRQGIGFNWKLCEPLTPSMP